MTSKKWFLIFFILIIMVCVIPGACALDQYGVGNTSYGMFRDDNQMEWIAAHEPVSVSDLNDNGRIDFADIVKLFREI